MRKSFLILTIIFAVIWYACMYFTFAKETSTIFVDTSLIVLFLAQGNVYVWKILLVLLPLIPIIMFLIVETVISLTKSESELNSR